jgi:hypothetical protein
MSRRCHYVEHGGRRNERIVLTMNIGPHCESGVRVAQPGRDYSDRDASQVHERSTGVAGIVKPQLPHFGACEQPPPVERQRLRVKSVSRPGLRRRSRPRDSRRLGPDDP